MPLYAYKCPVCAAQRDILKPIAEIDRTEHCHKCDFAMNRQVCAPRVIPDYPGYECPVSGKWIEGRRAHEENLARTGCRIYEPGETQQAMARAKAEEEALFERVGETAAKAVAQLPPEKQERLACELDSGVDLSYDRATVSPTT